MGRSRKTTKRTPKKRPKPARSKSRASRAGSRAPKKQQPKSDRSKQLTTWLTVALVVVAAVGIYRHFLAEPSAPADSERSGRSSASDDEDSRNESASSRRRESEDDGEAASSDRRRPSRSKRKLPPPADVEEAPGDADTTDSGLASKVLAKGSGSDHPGPRDVVTVHYTGWTTDGEMFDSSVVRGKTTSFPLNRVIKGWTEGVQLMVKGEKRRLWIPEKLAYKGRPGAPAGMLVFDIELVDFESTSSD